MTWVQFLVTSWFYRGAALLVFYLIYTRTDGRKVRPIVFSLSAFDSAENLHTIKVSTLCRFPSALHILYLSCCLGRAEIFGNLSFLYYSTYRITA